MRQPGVSTQLVIRNSKMGLASQNRENRESGLLAGEGKEPELNNNSLSLDHNKHRDLDLMIQDQYNILSLAVQNIIAVSSEDIYSSKSTEKKLANSETKESRSLLLPLEEDVDFKEVLNRFSEETRSLSSENFLAAPVKNISKSLGRKYLNRSFNTFPIIDEGRSSILYFILICF